MTSRKRGVVSYKEESDVTDSELVVEYRGGMEVEDNREKVEKVLKMRTGRVGGEREGENQSLVKKYQLCSI